MLKKTFAPQFTTEKKSTKLRKTFFSFSSKFVFPFYPFPNVVEMEMGPALNWLLQIPWLSRFVLFFTELIEDTRLAWH